MSSGAVALRMLTVAGVGAPLDGVGSGAVSLRMLVASGSGLALDGDGRGAVALAMLQVAGQGSETQFGSGAVVLQRVAAIGVGSEELGLPVQIVPVTGLMRADGGGILEFDGPPNRGVSWSITEGEGLVTPFTDYTDQYGRAYARYDAGGYSGPLTVEVEYGA